MQSDRYRMGFHLTPPAGWLNDPNGLCQIDGVYHVFFQYSPDWPAAGAERGWGHATSRDLVRWEHHGWAIRADAPFDADGAYSGCALVQPGAGVGGTGAAEQDPDAAGALSPAASFYYTGNVKHPGNFDYVRAGREANLVRVDSPDGYEMGPKRLLMGNGGYPAYCSCHVRDPKVWREGGAGKGDAEGGADEGDAGGADTAKRGAGEGGADGRLYMLLGARDRADQGFALLYRSDDGLAWQHVGDIRTPEPFGYMWECPDRIRLDGFEYLSCCPQGMEGMSWANGVRDQAGYFALAAGERLAAAPAVDAARFRRWDAGFDFYAPQTFVDEAGRTLLIGWMGLPDPPFESAPNDMDWIHCLTVPRVLSRAVDGTIAQAPVPELEALRGEPVALRRDGGGMRANLPEHRADLVFEGVGEGFAAVLDGALEVRCADGEVALRFVEPFVGAGRTERRLPVTSYGALRILVDSSAVEVFAADGRAVFSTRWFPQAEELAVSATGPCAAARAWPLCC